MQDFRSIQYFILDKSKLAMLCTTLLMSDKTAYNLIILVDTVRSFSCLNIKFFEIIMKLCASSVHLLQRATL